MKARAVHVSHSPYDVYIGRGPDPKTGRRLSGTRWGNPYTRARHGPNAMRLYLRYLRSHPWVVDRARAELSGKLLGCWCKPDKACHGDVLAALANGKSLDDIEAEWEDTLAETREMFA